MMALPTDREQADKLRSLLPVILEKETHGLINPSHEKAKSLISWHERGIPYTDKQKVLIGQIIFRAERKQHRKTTVTVHTGGPAVDESALEQRLLTKVLAQVEARDARIDENAVMERVSEIAIRALEDRVPREVVIKVERADGKMAKVDGPRHKMFEHLCRAASTRLPNGYAPGIFLQGEASSGKTTGAKMLAETLKLKWHFNGAISFPHEMLGFIDGAGKYHRTPFRDAYEHGGVYTFDEVDRSDPVALLAVNPHLANGVATFPDKQVKRHKDCIIICTANTWGLGADANYSGATKLDAAFLSRFPVRINWDIDPDLEEQIVPHVEWLGKVRQARVRARAVGLKVLIDTRAAQAGLALIQAGYTLDEAANFTYLANLKADQRTLLTGVTTGVPS